MVLLGYLLMCLVFGTTFLAIKVGIDAGSLPFLSAGMRFIAAGMILLLAMKLKGKGSFSLLWQKETLFTGAGLTFGTFSALYWGEQYVSSGLAAVLSATGPIMILIMQTSVMGQKASKRSVMGCVVGFIGVALVMLPGLSLHVSLLWIVGCAAILIGEICYSSGALYSKQAMSRFPEASPVALNAAQMTVGGVFLFLLSWFTEQPDWSVYSTVKGAGSLLYLIVIGSMVGHTLFYWLVSKTNPVFPSTWLYISPPIAMTLGWVLYGEPVSWITGAGVFAILTGIILVNYDALRHMVMLQRKGKHVPRDVEPVPAQART